MEKTKFSTGETVKVINAEPLKGNEIAPPLMVGDKYKVKEIQLDKNGNQHIDIGLPSAYEFIRSYETGEQLERGNKIHWCHPSRFEVVSD
jgi:hypothetical protein